MTVSKDASLDAQFYTFCGSGLGAPAAIGEAGIGKLISVTEWHLDLNQEENNNEDEAFFLGYQEKYSDGGKTPYYGRIHTTMDMLAAATDKAGSTNPKDIAYALESIEYETPYGKVLMRAEDHQLIQPLYLSVFAKAGEGIVKYDAENTGAEFSAYRMFMLVISVVMFVGLYLVLTRTRIGLIIQAALTHPDGVSALGHNVPAVFMLVFGGGSALAGLAGVIGGIFLITEPAMAATMGPIVFVVIVVGGMGSLTGAFVASLLLAAIQTFAVGIEYSLADLFAAFGLQVNAGGLLGDIWRIQLSHTGPILPYLFMVLMLMFRPKGLMGKCES